MATYSELYSLRNNTDLLNKIAVAVVIKAKDFIALATPSASQVAWANKAISEPVQQAGKLMNYLLASSSSSTVNQITGASDATIQTKVNEAVDKLLDVL